MSDQRERLRKIQTFPSLVKYLRDELDWPISSDDFDDLTFDYTPEEIGLDAATAAKIDGIKRLRPLTATQPWGIYFVKFEPKHLPVLALRRILNRVATKNRASSNPSEMPSWEMANLILISSYGEDSSRQISFAHFTQPEEGSILPELKVLGWDNRDSPLHLDHVADVLAEKLIWPDDQNNTDTWLQQWRSAFTLTHRQVITTSQMLSIELARLARNIRERINTVLSIESEDGELTRMLHAFRGALIHDLEPGDFADMYAQTISYGLLSSRIVTSAVHTPADSPTTALVTNPFLRELMRAFLDVGSTKGGSDAELKVDFDELGITEITDLLDAADMEAVIRDFGDENPLEDPVLHFYELFLKEYDPAQRMSRGVFYTPQPVVSFMVRSVDEMLRTEFGLEDGLADTITWGELTRRNETLEVPADTASNEPFVQILDPATGTGTFLVEIIDLIHNTMKAKWRYEGNTEDTLASLWNVYVRNHLLPRLHGYELLMAPYAIAHLKIGLKLRSTGYNFSSNDRLGVYLTNALERNLDITTLDFIGPALASEVTEVNTLKRDKRFTIVIGNPPYSLTSSNLKATHRDLITKYKFIDNQPLQERGALQLEKILNDDYVKFFALSQELLSASGQGVLGLITNHAYLDNRTMRGMRYSILNEFPLGNICNLHGSVKKLMDTTDENVFDIQQGVSITLAAKSKSRIERDWYYSELYGSRRDKYDSLLARTITNMDNVALTPGDPYFLLTPDDDHLWSEYEQFTPLTEIFPLRSIGLFTSKDSLVIDRHPDNILKRVVAFQQSDLQNRELCEQFGIKAKKAWDVTKSRDRLQSLSNIADSIEQFQHRPFDKKSIFYDKSLVWSMAYPVNRNLLRGDNVALTVSRQLANPPWNHVFCSNTIVELCYISNKTKEGNHVFPLYIYNNPDGELLFDDNSSRQLNIADSFISLFNTCLEGEIDGSQSIRQPEDIFDYCYALLHSATFRQRYQSFLAFDFPRIPIPREASLLSSLVDLGKHLKKLHLMDFRTVHPTTALVGTGDFRVEKVSYSEETVWIDEAKEHGFAGVPEAVWTFRIGAYQVCEKWLKDRQAKGGKNPRLGDVLTDDQIGHYQNVVFVLSETILQMQEIENVIGAHGGWPTAFTGE